jgi:hypothetical protein
MLANHEATGFNRGRRFLYAFGLGGLLVALFLASPNWPTVLHAAKTEAGQANQPRIIIASTTLTEEPCVSPDGVIDPGETVTVTSPWQNTARPTRASNWLLLYWQPARVTAPSASQNYGALSRRAGSQSGEVSALTAAAQEIGSTLTGDLATTGREHQSRAQ